ncbi:hypothetical protein B0H11DRAFT_1231715 [Mycena galericulata]|nr:hypothetical protein B0H11DRAFT_1231715 [Mycena galericulata]
MSTTTGSPFDIQELVDYCIDFLHDSRPDLKTCTLVGRAWVQSAQFHLFWNMTFFDSLKDQHLRISQIGRLSRSPHILAFVCCLHVRLHYLALDAFSAAIPLFAHLQELRVSGDCVPSVPSFPGLVTLRALLSLPTLQRVEIYCTFPHPLAFMKVWSGCSESIRHLMLWGVRVNDTNHDWNLSSAVDSRPKIRLESLRLSYSTSIIPWLATDACPFDFSGLTALSVGEDTRILRWNAFSGAVAAIKRLEIGFISTQPSVDLSPFGRLQELIIHVHSHLDAEIALDTLNTLSSVPTISRINTIGIYPNFTHRMSQTLTRLDTLLASLPLPELRAVPMPERIGVVTLEKHCPRLHARELLAVVSSAS